MCFSVRRCGGDLSTATDFSDGERETKHPSHPQDPDDWPQHQTLSKTRSPGPQVGDHMVRACLSWSYCWTSSWITALNSGSCRVEAALRHWFVTGLQQEGVVPSLIASVGDSSSSLLNVLFELNPQESSADQLLRVHSQPVEMIYDAVSASSAVGSHLYRLFSHCSILVPHVWTCSCRISSWRWTAWWSSSGQAEVWIWRSWRLPRSPNWRRSRRKQLQVSLGPVLSQCIRVY